jgi:MFS family permease
VSTSTSPVSAPYRVVTLTVVALVTIIAFEAMAISTIMPTVGAELGAGSAYGLAFSLMFTAQLLGIVVAAPWIDRSGPLPVALIGQGLFAVGSAVAGLAPTFAILLLGRLVAGLGAGVAVVALYVVIGAAYPSRLRPAVMAWVSTAWVLPSVLGPVVAAAMTQQWSWRVVFLVVVPMVVVTTIGLRRVRELVAEQLDRSQVVEAAQVVEVAEAAEVVDPVSERAGHRRAARLGFGVAVGAGAFQWASGSLVPPSALPIVTAVIGLVVVVWTARELLPAGTFAFRPGLPALMASRFLLTAAMNGGTTFVPLMLVDTRGLSISQAGVLLTITSLGWSLASWIQGRPVFRGRGTFLVTAGGSSVTTGVLGLAISAGLGFPTWFFAIDMLFIGLGMGLSMSAMNVLMLELAPPAEHATASSALQLSDVLGSVVGIATAGALYAALGTTRTGTEATIFVVIWVVMALSAAGSALAGSRCGGR